MKQYEMFELTFQGEEPEGSYVDVNLTANFTQNGETIKVKGFFSGNGTYKVRYYPVTTGDCHYTVKGVVNAEGDEVCGESLEGVHGMVKADNNHFCYEDNTWYYPFGTTVYALIHQDKALIDQTMETLKTAPFNKIRICMFPKSFEYNQNEPDYYAFEKKGELQWDVNKPCFAFWDSLEERIWQLNEMGIQCDLILFHPYDRWGFSKLTKEDNLVYLDYVTRRLSAFPIIWWSLANEYDLMENSKEEWEAMTDFIHAHDPYGHLLSNHYCFRSWDFNNKDTTHVCLQIKSVDKISDVIEKYQKPLMVDECCYEGNISYEWGNISAFELVNRFWKTCVQGGYCTHGETYLSEDDIIWWSKGGVLKGESPKRITFLKNIMEALPGPLSFVPTGFTKEIYKKYKLTPISDLPDDAFIKGLFSATWEEVDAAMASGKQFLGCYEDMAYLLYYDRHCTSIGALDLPMNGNYNVEVIDVWEMTRTPVLQGVNGQVKIKLPGKEGVAVLALKVSE